MAGPWRVRFIAGEDADALAWQHRSEWAPEDKYGYQFLAKFHEVVVWPLYRDEQGQPFGFRAICPLCWMWGWGALSKGAFPDRPVWTWNGSEEMPTLSPSVAPGPNTCPMHVWVTNGQIIDAGTPLHGPKEA